MDMKHHSDDSYLCNVYKPHLGWELLEAWVRGPIIGNLNLLVPEGV